MGFFFQKWKLLLLENNANIKGLDKKYLNKNTPTTPYFVGKDKQKTY